MGITKQYLRYTGSGDPFGIIASSDGKVQFVPSNVHLDRLVAISGCENVMIWDLKTGDSVKLLRGDKVAVSTFDVHDNLLVIGYADGSIKLFDHLNQDLKVTFAGHKTTVSCITFDVNGMRLASGGKDTDIVVWDVVNEAGLFRLKGHKHVVTQLAFLSNHSNILISSSRDTYIKFWDLTTQHCFRTLLGHRSEIWNFCILNDELLFTGASDSEIRVWSIHFKNEEGTFIPPFNESNHEDDGEENSLIKIRKKGSILRESSSRLRCLKMDLSSKTLLCTGNDSIVECFKILTESEVEANLLKKQKREKKKLKRLNSEIDVNSVDINVERTFKEEYERLKPFKVNGKIKFSDLISKGNVLKIAILLHNNSIEHYTLKPPGYMNEEPGTISKDGHRSDIRTLAFSSDNYYILSASSEAVKIWNKNSKKCIATVTDGCEYALCSLFAPGDRYVVVGTKFGKLLIFDIGSATLSESILASEDKEPIWSLCLYPDQKGLVTGSEDKIVKFWNFDLVKDDETNVKRLTLIHTRTLKMDEGVLCVKISPNNKLIAVSLLDSTVKIFFMDSLKFFLSLYGHKFPVLCMDISYDSTLIATGSSDKNIKLWGLDFGDCHKSIFAHDDSIMSLQFVPKSHYLFSCSKDKTLKQWDADNYEKIITLTGHQAEVWTLAVSPNGKFVATASHDRSIRLWERTEEPLILEEEKENEREQEFEKNAYNDDETILPGETNAELGLASKKTCETVKSSEKLIEAIDVYKEEKAKQKAYVALCLAAKEHGSDPPAPFIPNLLMSIYKTTCPLRFVLETLKKIKSSELEDALITLPFNYVCLMLQCLAEFLEAKWEIELVCRSTCFIIRIFFGQITSTATLVPTIEKLKSLMANNIDEERDLIGFNLAGLQFLRNQMDAKDEVSLFTDAFSKFKDKKRKKSKKIKQSAPVLSLS